MSYEKPPKAKQSPKAGEKSVVFLTDTGNSMVTAQNVSLYRNLGYEYAGKSPDGVITMEAPAELRDKLIKQAQDTARERAKSQGAPLPLPGVRQDIDVSSRKYSKSEIEEAIASSAPRDLDALDES